LSLGPLTQNMKPLHQSKTSLQHTTSMTNN